MRNHIDPQSADHGFEWPRYRSANQYLRPQPRKLSSARSQVGLFKDHVIAADFIFPVDIDQPDAPRDIKDGGYPAISDWYGDLHASGY